MKNQKNRSMKVYSQNGRNYKELGRCGFTAWCVFRI